MSTIGETITSELARIATELRLTLHDNPARSIDIGDPAAIASTVPDAVIDWGRDAFRERRSRITFERGKERTTLLVRHRPDLLADQVDPSGAQRAKGPNGQPVTVSRLDERRRTLHVLVDLEDARPVCGPATSDVAVEVTIAAPLRGLVAKAATVVGSEVPDRIQEFLQSQPAADEPRIREEIGESELFEQLGLLPRRLRARLDRLREALGADATAVVRKWAKATPERLARLIESRAVSTLRFDRDSLSGRINPRITRRCALPPLAFRYMTVASRGLPSLEVWDPRAGWPVPQCLGGGLDTFSRLGKELDCYSLVDAVINFTERNSLFGIRRRGPMGTLRETLFSAF